MSRFARLILLLLSLLTAGTALAAPAPVTVAVLPFTKLKGDKSLWLDKAIADLVAQKLIESPDLAVLNRDALQTFLKEMQFQESGFVTETQTIARVGKIAKTDQVVYGNYAVEGNQITLHLMVLQVSDQKLLGEYKEEGSLPDLVALTQKLGGHVLDGKSEKPPRQQNFKPTDSITALEHFYEGIRLYDNGEHEQAMGAFFAATEQDPHYLDAQLWFARMLEQLGKDEQAIIAYQKLYAMAPERIEGIDAQFFAARLMAKSRPADAVKLYHTLSTIQPEIPETIEAAFAEAQLQRTLGNVKEAYLLYKQVDDYSDKVRKHLIAYTEKQAGSDAARNRYLAMLWRRLQFTQGDQNPETKDIKHSARPLRQSRFFGWEHSLGLYRDAVTAMVELYSDLPAPLAGEQPMPVPRGSFLVDAANPVISGDIKNKDKSLFGGDHTYMPQWSEIFYALIIPQGYVATGIDLQITGNLPEPSDTRDFTLRVMPFPLKENYHNSWLGAIFGQTQTTTTLNKHIPFFGNTQKLLALQLVENFGHIERWQVKLTLVKQAELAQTPEPASSDTSVDGALLAKLRIGGNETRTIRTQPQFILQRQPQQKLALANNYNDGIWLVGVKGDLLGEATDLWQSHSEDGGKTWSSSEPMSVNSSSLEFAPTLVRREDGAIQLFFLSDRRGLGWELWTSAQDRKSKRWSNARIVPLSNFAATGFEQMADISGEILPYSVMQDNHGIWNAAFYSKVTRKVHILRSEDLERWSQISEISPQGALSLALGQDLTGRYYLVNVDNYGRPLIYTSNDAASWKYTTMISKRYNDPRAISTFPMTLLPQKDGMMLVFSDILTGLQYIKISAAGLSQPDLVTQSALDTFAIIATDTGYITAQWKDDDVHLQRYTSLAFPDNLENKVGEIIYTERSKDAKGGVWDRIFARERYRVPDVTSIAAVPGGRIWWGRETGIMALKGLDFYLKDVSEGFFFHFVDNIRYCGDKVWFTSSQLAPAQAGFNKGADPHMWSLGKAISLNELGGTVIATGCSDKGEMYFASASGQIVALSMQEERKQFALPDAKDGISSLTYDSHAKRLLVGTGNGTLYHVDGENGFNRLYQKPGHALNAVAVDVSGAIWVGLQGQALEMLDASGKLVKHYDLSANLHKLVADGKKGVWAASDYYSTSPGLIHADKDAITVHNPPQRILGQIIDFDMAEDGTLWIGTNLDGIYHYRSNP